HYDERLIAYLVTRDPVAPTDREMRAFLRRKLPDYMVPSMFARVESLPLTANGKVDKKALPDPLTTSPKSPVELVAPRGGAEQAIADIWKQVLRVESVGVNENFFDLGGHSLLMAQAHGMIRRRFGRDVPLLSLLEHPTIASLAEYLTKESRVP